MTGAETLIRAGLMALTLNAMACTTGVNRQPAPARAKATPVAETDCSKQTLAFELKPSLAVKLFSTDPLTDNPKYLGIGRVYDLGENSGVQSLAFEPGVLEKETYLYFPLSDPKTHLSTFFDTRGTSVIAQGEIRFSSSPKMGRRWKASFDYINKNICNVFSLGWVNREILQATLNSNPGHLEQN